VNILYFSPHSGIWEHSLPESIIIESLKNSGARISYVTCGSVFEGLCVTRRAHGLSSKSSTGRNRKICDICNQSAKAISKNFKFENTKISDFVDENDLLEIDKILSSSTGESVLNYQFEGIPIGRISYYQLVLRYKLNSIKLDDDKWSEYMLEFRNSLVTAYAGARIFSTLKPDKLIVSNGLYSVNRVMVALAEKRKIPAFSIQAGINLNRRLERLAFGRDHYFRFFNSLLDAWAVFSKRPVNKQALESIESHFKELVGGKNMFVYSQQKRKNQINLRDYFKIPKDKKIILATMSSNDEIFAALMSGVEIENNFLFPTQNDWIKFLMEFVGARDDLFLIVRPHPREFPNKRESQISESSKLFSELFKKIPNNAVLNVPADNLSIFDFVEDVDLVLNSASSVGKELSLLGIPVLSYAQALIPYPANLNYFADSLDSYKAEIQNALARGWDYELIKKSYRWSAMELEYALIDLGGCTNIKESSSKNWLENFATRVFRKISLPLYFFVGCFSRTKLNNSELIAELIKNNQESILDKPLKLSNSNLIEDFKREDFLIKKSYLILLSFIYPSKKIMKRSRLYRKVTI
jgi:hypothetical protein